MPIDCTNPGISLNELMNSLLVKTNTGVKGLRVKMVSASAANIEPVIGCATFNLSDTDVVRHAIGLTTSGKPCLILIEET